MKNMMNRKERNIQTFAAKNEEDKPKIGLYIVRKCAENIPQMAKWDTPNDEMGHPKRRNGIPQMVKWDTPKGEMGYPKR